MSPEPPDLDALEHPDEADPVGATPPERLAPPVGGDGAGVSARDEGSVGPVVGELVPVDGALALEPDEDGAAPATPPPEAPDCCAAEDGATRGADVVEIEVVRTEDLGTDVALTVPVPGDTDELAGAVAFAPVAEPLDVEGAGDDVPASAVTANTRTTSTMAAATRRRRMNVARSGRVRRRATRAEAEELMACPCCRYPHRAQATTRPGAFPPQLTSAQTGGTMVASRLRGLAGDPWSISSSKTSTDAPRLPRARPRPRRCRCGWGASTRRMPSR